MKFVYIVIIIFLAAGVFYIFTDKADAPVADTSVDTASVTETSEMSDDSTTEVTTDTETTTVIETEAADMSIETETSAEADATTKVFDISGINFAFDVEEIRVQEGDTVTINFESAQGFHDWVVDEFDAATAQVSDSDGVTSVTFVADTAGTYEYYCSVGSHRANGMVGTLIVE